MSKMFSETTPDEYKEMIAQAVDTAKAEGEAKVVDEVTGDELLLSAVDGDVVVEDKYNDGVEKTLITSNPDDENDLVLTAVEEKNPDGTVTTGTVETKTESEDQNLKSVEIEVLPGKGEEPEADLVDNLRIEVDPDVEGTQRYSMNFKNFSEKKAKMIAKLFSECKSAIEEMCNCDVAEDVQVKFKGDKMKCFSLTIGKDARTFSEEEEPTEEPTAEPTSEPTEEPTEAPTEEPTTEPTAEPEVKTEEEVVEEGDALTDKVNEEGITKENADEIRTKADDLIIDAEKVECYSKKSMKAFKTLMKVYSDKAAEVKGDPKVTVTIENLEPATVADLLGGPEKEEEPKTDVEPKVNPNDNSFSGPRSFSLKDRMTKKGESESINPYLTTEIY